MTFAAIEGSRALGKPISLYFFRYGDASDAFFAYTDAAADAVLEFDPDLGPVTFVATPIKREGIVVSGVLDKATLTIRTPQDTALADLFMTHPPSQQVILTIWDGHIGEDDIAVVWSGRVTSHASEANESVLSCEPVSTSLKRTGLTRNFQIPCPLALYGPDCRADRETATISTNALGVNGPLVSLPDSWAPADRKTSFAQGIASWVTVEGRTEQRTIIRLRDLDNTLVLSGVASGLTPALELKLTLGCRHTLEDCSTLHDNIQNYGGQWLIPTDNPFGIKNNFG